MEASYNMANILFHSHNWGRKVEVAQNTDGVRSVPMCPTVGVAWRHLAVGKGRRQHNTALGRDP